MLLLAQDGSHKELQSQEHGSEQAHPRDMQFMQEIQQQGEAERPSTMKSEGQLALRRLGEEDPPGNQQIGDPQANSMPLPKKIARRCLLCLYYERGQLKREGGQLPGSARPRRTHLQHQSILRTAAEPMYLVAPFYLSA